MNRTCFATAVIAGLAGFADHAGAVNLNPNGLGQVLIYPYYTVNAGQQTLLSVVNTTNVGKAVKVHFLESYNGRDVLDFNVFLSRYDVWTAVVFKLSDAGISGDGAGIFTTDKSCMAPALTQGPLSNGANYQKFLNYTYTGAGLDTGPITDDRTNEGHFEMISMADVVPTSALDLDITHVNGVPTRCTSAENDLEANRAFVAPTSGLFGSVSIVDVAEGTFYAYNADAIDGFTYVPLISQTGEEPTLASANDRNSTLTATSRVFADGESLTSTFSKAHAIDAVSSVFAAENIYNEYVSTQDGAIGTDWVLTFPTKRFYVDPQFVTIAIPPFEHLFGAVEGDNDLGLSCTVVGISIFDREENVISNNTGCGFPECPPGPPPSAICLETNVIRFANTSVMGSELPAERATSLRQGILRLTLAGPGHDMNPANNGNVFHGLPVTGFAATKFVNNFVPLPGGGYALANYTATYHHRATIHCTNSGPCS
jgi:hypothetical protein